MSLISWEPLDEFDRAFRDLSRSPSLELKPFGFDLAADMYEDDNNLVIEMNLPGLSTEDIEVTTEDTHLRIAGKREEQQEKKKKNHYTKEIRRGSFDRIIALPSGIDTESIEATYKDGVLRVTMPRSPESTKRNVSVTAG